MSCRRSASSPAPTRSSTARSCSPRAIRTSSAIAPCWRGSASSPKVVPWETILARCHRSPKAASRLALVMKRQPLEPALEDIERQHLRRRRATVEAYPEKGSHTQVIVDGAQLVDFSSNDYLGLAAHPALAAAMAECATRCGGGSGASHLISGHGR